MCKKNPRYKRGLIDSYRVFLFFCFEYNFFPPYNAPAAINKEIPPSIGIHGGGQQCGPPDGGGGGPAAIQYDVSAKVKIIENKILICIEYLKLRW